MDFTIQLPAMASNKGQVDAVVGILEEKVTPPNRKGIQLLVFLKEYALDWKGVSKAISENLKGVPGEYVNTLHAPISPTKPNELVDLRERASLRTVLDMAEFAGDHGIGNITLHSNAVTMMSDWDEKYSLESRRSEDRKKILDNLARVATVYPYIHFGLENLPLPIMGDAILEPSRSPFEFFMTESLDIVEFARELGELGRNLGLCLDVDHYEIYKAKAESLLSKYGLDFGASDMDKEGLRGLSLPLGFPESLGELVRKIRLAEGNIFDCQIGGYDGSLWLPGKQTFREGQVLSDENMGEEIVRGTRGVIGQFPGCNVSIDVNVDEYIKRPEQRASLDYFLAKVDDL